MEQREVGSNDASTAVTLGWGPGGCGTTRCSGQPLTPRDPQQDAHPAWDWETTQWPYFKGEFWKCWQLPVVHSVPPSCFHHGIDSSYFSLTPSQWWQWHPLNISILEMKITIITETFLPLLEFNEAW